MGTNIKRNLTRETRKRAAVALFVMALLLALGLFLSQPPVFKAPPEARVLVSRRNPFWVLTGPVYFERLASSRPPAQFWAQTKQVFGQRDGVEFDPDLRVLGVNGSEARNHRQASFKVLGVPQIPLSSPRFDGNGRLRGAHIVVYLWADGDGGSVMELWVTDRF